MESGIDGSNVAPAIVPPLPPDAPPPPPPEDNAKATEQCTLAQYATIREEEQYVLQQQWQLWQIYQLEYAEWYKKYGEQYEREMVAAAASNAQIVTQLPLEQTYTQEQQQSLMQPLSLQVQPQPQLQLPSQIIAQPQMYNKPQVAHEPTQQQQQFPQQQQQQTQPPMSNHWQPQKPHDRFDQMLTHNPGSKGTYGSNEGGTQHPRWEWQLQHMSQGRNYRWQGNDSNSNQGVSNMPNQFGNRSCWPGNNYSSNPLLFSNFDGLSFGWCGRNGRGHFGRICDSYPNQPEQQQQELVRLFNQWEKQFEDWKRANANHSDRIRYRHYIEEFETLRHRIAERLKQMRCGSQMQNSRQQQQQQRQQPGGNVGDSDYGEGECHSDKDNNEQTQQQSQKLTLIDVLTQNLRQVKQENISTISLNDEVDEVLQQTIKDVESIKNIFENNYRVSELDSVAKGRTAAAGTGAAPATNQNDNSVRVHKSLPDTVSNALSNSKFMNNFSQAPKRKREEQQQPNECSHYANNSNNNESDDDRELFFAKMNDNQESGTQNGRQDNKADNALVGERPRKEHTFQTAELVCFVAPS